MNNEKIINEILAANGDIDTIEARDGAIVIRAWAKPDKDGPTYNIAVARDALAARLGVKLVASCDPYDDDGRVVAEFEVE